MRRVQESKSICVGNDKEMGNRVTIIVGAGAVLDFDHKGIFPSVKNITDEVLKLSIQKVDGGERPLLREINPNRSLGPISSGDVKVLSCSPESKECLPLIYGSHKT